jgi:hypothetical protein
MSYLIRVEDSQGRIKSYFKVHDLTRARYIYSSIKEQCLERGQVIKLLNEDFHVLQTSLQHTTARHRSTS